MIVKHTMNMLIVHGKNTVFMVRGQSPHVHKVAGQKPAPNKVTSFSYVVICALEFVAFYKQCIFDVSNETTMPKSRIPVETKDSMELAYDIQCFQVHSIA